MPHMRYLLISLFLLSSLFWIQPLSSAMTGGNFELYADGFSFIDTDPQTGGNFTLYGSGGEFAVSTTEGGVIAIRSGFEALEKAILGFTLNPSTVTLSNMSLTTVASSSMTMTVNTASTNGYTVSIQEDGNLRAGANEITDATAGQVITAGTEAYGFVPSGTDVISATTTPITSSAANIVTYSGVATSRTSTLDFQLGISTATAIGAYSHALTFIITVNP